MKLLPRAQVLEIAAAAGIPIGRQELFAPDEIGANVFATVSRDWVAEVAQATLEELRRNAPELVDVRQLGGGKTRLVPRYVLNGFCCRGHSLKAYSNGMLGFAVQGARAAAAGAPLPYDGLAWGFYHFTASPRPENYQRDGRHEKLWGIDHDLVFFNYEFGDVAFESDTPAERQTYTLLYAQ